MSNPYQAAQIAYEAYASASGTGLPTFDTLTSDVQQAWQNVANAVTNFYNGTAKAA